MSNLFYQYHPISKAANKRAVRVAYRNGQLTLRVPAASVTPYYHLKPNIHSGAHLHIPAQGGSTQLGSRVYPSAQGYSARGIGRVLVSGPAVRFLPSARKP